jgi:hypothetical protein
VAAPYTEAIGSADLKAPLIVSTAVFAFFYLVATINPADSPEFPGVAAQVIPTLLIALSISHDCLR